MTYVISQRRTFYRRADRISLVPDNCSGHAAVFQTRKAALAYIDQLDQEDYSQSHNEYGRPKYRVRRVADLPGYLTYDLPRGAR